jgi:hypothetical protein
MANGLMHHICVLQIFDMNSDLTFGGVDGCIFVIVFFHALEKWELSCVPFSLSNSKTKN